MHSLNKSLFGGALLAAGMVATNAQAGEFIFQATNPADGAPSFAYSQAYATGLDIAYGVNGLLNTFATAYSGATGTTTASTTQTSTLMRTDISWGGDGAVGYGYGRTFMQQFFQVSNDSTLLIEWDFSGTDGYSSSFVLETAGGTVIFANEGLGGGTFAGSASISLSAGVDYAAIFGFRDQGSGFGPFIFSTNNQFISMTLVKDGVIPTPGALGLFGLAGFAAARRRRG